MTTSEAQALDRAQHGQSMVNYSTIVREFSQRGIPTHEIHPRVNVLTYKAWRAEGRQVRRGERGVKVLTFQHNSKEEKQTDGTMKRVNWSRPWHATVFHVTQTIPR